MITSWVVDRSRDDAIELGAYKFVALPRMGEIIGLRTESGQQWFIVERIDHHGEPMIGDLSDKQPNVSILVKNVGPNDLVAV